MRPVLTASRIGVSAGAVAVVMALAACTSGTSNEAAATKASAATPRTTVTAAGSTTVSTPTPSTSRSTTGTTTGSPVRTTAPTPPVRVPRGTVVVLNPGHDGEDASHPAEVNRLVPSGYGERKPCEATGTNTDAGYPEHAFNWDVAVRVRRILESAGITVRMTRPNDTGVGPCVDVRAAIGNRSDVAAVVSIHADGAPSADHGFHVNQASKRPDGATAQVAAQSRALGSAIHRTLVSSSGLTVSNYIGRDGYYYRSDFAALNLATRPATFLELGNMRNPHDAALLSSKAGRARIASAVALGIIAFVQRS